MSDRPPLTATQRAIRTGLAWGLEILARAVSRGVESVADDVAKEAARKRKAVRDWRVKNVPEDADEEEGLQ